MVSLTFWCELGVYVITKTEFVSCGILVENECPCFHVSQILNH